MQIPDYAHRNKLHSEYRKKKNKILTPHKKELDLFYISGKAEK